MSSNQTQRVVFITGVSSGIGRAAALAFARAGYHVAGTARRHERLLELQEEINALPELTGSFLPLESDVTDAQSVHDAVSQTVDTYGRLDVLVANAGIGLRGALADVAWEDIQSVLHTNIDGVLHSIRACVPHMQRSGGGHIMIISSVTATLVAPYTSIYAATKAFVSSIANSIRIELAPDNIRVTDYLVGRTQTEFNQRRLGEGKRTGRGIPTMSPEQVAQKLVDTAFTGKKSVVIRFFDRLILWGNRFFPAIMGQLAKRQYK